MVLSKEIVRLLPTLSGEDLRQAKGLINNLVRDSYSNDDQLLVDTCRRALAAKGLDVPPWAVIIKRFRTLVNQANKACNFYVDKIDKNANKLKREQIRVVLTNLVIRDIVRRNNYPLSLKTLLIGLCSIGSIIDDQFPGYSEAQLLNLIVDLKAVVF